MQELVQRDKNRPSVIAWSIANEPASEQPAALKYFEKVANFTRNLDPDNRPVMAVLSRSYEKDHAPPSLDMIGVNRYVIMYFCISVSLYFCIFLSGILAGTVTLAIWM